jgi:putative SOS response-associated peptidase YedK
MCGRFVLCSPTKTIIEEFRIDKTTIEYIPSYNIAPTQNIVIVKKDGTRILTNCKWGFIPSWAQDPSIGYKMINARAGIIDKPAFKSALRNSGVSWWPTGRVAERGESKDSCIYPP